MSEININPKKENVDLINRKPLAYMLGVCILLLSVFITRSFLTDNKRTDDCKDQVLSVSKERDSALKKADVANDKLVQYLLTERERRSYEQKERDSVVNSVVGTKAKRILINSKKR